MKKTPLKRTRTLKRTTRVKPRNPKRKAAEFARAYGSAERVAFVKTLPCLVGRFLCPSPSENAHVRTGGTGRKADAKHAIPLCSRHHLGLHNLGRGTFEKFYFLDLDAEAAKTEAAWQAHVAAQHKENA